MTTQPSSKDRQARDWYEKVELLFRGIVALLAVFAALRAASTYQKEVDAKIFDDQLKVRDEIFAQTTDLMRSTSREQFDRDLVIFGTSKHSHALEAFGDQGAIYVSMVNFYNSGMLISNSDEFWVQQREDPEFAVAEALDQPCENMANAFNAFFREQATHNWWHIW